MHYIEVLDTSTGNRVLLRSSIEADWLRERGPTENSWYWDEVVFSPDLKRVACRWRGRRYGEYGFIITDLERLPLAVPLPASSD